ncbi:hypothetical protein [Streptomyces sp. NPDC050121]|uniref:hypothetical protein n=1 Tax=Streptomyces sp. NPDC050121 TaxID=3365601 RepID=UPI003793B133
MACYGDEGYQGAGGTVRAPFRGKHRDLSVGQQAVNVVHARIRAVGEQAMATLKLTSPAHSAAAGIPCF